MYYTSFVNEKTCRAFIVCNHMTELVFANLCVERLSSPDMGSRRTHKMLYSREDSGEPRNNDMFRICFL